MSLVKEAFFVFTHFCAILQLIKVSYFMTSHNFLFYCGQIIAGLVGDLLRFPLWWYGKGWWELACRVVGWWSASLRGLNLIVWLKNLFVPMYGQNDWAGIFISFFVRLAQIIVRGLWFACLLVFGAVFLMTWLLLPLLAVWQIIFQLS